MFAISTRALETEFLADRAKGTGCPNDTISVPTGLIRHVLIAELRAKKGSFPPHRRCQRRREIETDEEGYAGARKLLWYIESNKVPPQYTSPPGYHPIASAVNAMKGSASAGIFRLFKNPAPLDEYMERGLVFAGNPDSVYRQIKKMYDHVGGFGHLLIMGQAGFLDHDETVKGMQMFAREVYPRLKELERTA